MKVNGDIITKTDLEQRQVGVLRQRNEQLAEQDSKTTRSSSRCSTKITPDILVDAMDELLLLQRAAISVIG